MSTDEMERLLVAALHEADGPVDVPGGRARLGRRLVRERLVRRWAVVGVAASILAVVVTTSLVLAGLRHDEESLPVSPPKIALSPSGLPVGLLEGKVDRTEANVTSTVRMVVRADGRGSGTPGRSVVMLDPRSPTTTSSSSARDPAWHSCESPSIHPSVVLRATP